MHFSVNIPAFLFIFSLVDLVVVFGLYHKYEMRFIPNIHPRTSVLLMFAFFYLFLMILWLLLVTVLLFTSTAHCVTKLKEESCPLLFSILLCPFFLFSFFENGDIIKDANKKLT